MSTSPELLQPIIGKRPWRVWKGVGSFLLFEFGHQPRGASDRAEKGLYTLWIYMATWRIHRGSTELAHSESPDAKIAASAEALQGLTLQSIILDTVVRPRMLRYAAKLVFEGQHQVSAYMYDRKKDDPIFMLYTPTHLITYDYDGRVKRKRMARSKA